MKSTLAVLLATTAVIGALAIPTLDAFARDTPDGTWPAVGADASPGTKVRLAMSDDDRPRDRMRRTHDHDDDGDDDDDRDDDDDDDDHDDTAVGRRATAPAGTIAPPKNGLFGTAAPPRAVID